MRLAAGPADIHRNRRSPPSPSGLSGPSLAPAMKPSADTLRPTMTFPMDPRYGGARGGRAGPDPAGQAQAASIDDDMWSAGSSPPASMTAAVSAGVAGG